MVIFVFSWIAFVLVYLITIKITIHLKIVKLKNYRVVSLHTYLLKTNLCFFFFFQVFGIENIYCLSFVKFYRANALIIKPFAQVIFVFVRKH